MKEIIYDNRKSIININDFKFDDTKIYILEYVSDKSLDIMVRDKDNNYKFANLEHPCSLPCYRLCNYSNDGKETLKVFVNKNSNIYKVYEFDNFKEFIGWYNENYK